MPIPGYQAFMRPLLELAADGKEHIFRDAVKEMAARFKLTEEDLALLIPSGTQRLLDNRVGWAKSYLVKAELLVAPRRSVFQITDRGREALGSGDSIDSRYLRRFPQFLEFVGGRSEEEPPVPASGKSTQTGEPSPAPERTPEELIETGYRQLQNALASDLLDLVQAAEPVFFERLVVDLLVKMGYGGSLGDAGSAIGKTGDHGIDGIIKEDRLGLDVIYLQAKRWTTGTIGRPEIQQFAGALQGQRARKGVFITTSKFTSEARQYAASIDTRIVLIDGTELAKLMIAHGVGVTTAITYELKRVDSDYFSDEE
jgi:restriction system protein